MAEFTLRNRGPAAKQGVVSRQYRLDKTSYNHVDVVDEHGEIVLCAAMSQDGTVTFTNATGSSLPTDLGSISTVEMLQQIASRDLTLGAARHLMEAYKESPEGSLEILRAWLIDQGYFEAPNITNFADADVVGEISRRGLGIIPKHDVSRTGESSEVGARNWRVENGYFYCRPLPDSPDATEIAIRIMDYPGDFTPENVPEVVGQPELLFTLAAAIHYRKPALLSGPTGTAKTTACYFLAQILNYNINRIPITGTTEAYHLLGTTLPDAQTNALGYMEGPVVRSVTRSHDHPEIMLLDELNRIGSQAEIACLYPLLDDSRMLELSEKRNSDGTVEQIVAGDLFVVATSNPSDDPKVSYIGVQDLDPALSSRFPFQVIVEYPEPEVETTALMARTWDTLQNYYELEEAFSFCNRVVEAANRIRQAENVSFPISFREMEAWLRLLPHLPFKDAAELAVLPKAAQDVRADVRNMLFLTEGA